MPLQSPRRAPALVSLLFVAACSGADPQSVFAPAAPPAQAPPDTSGGPQLPSTNDNDASLAPATCSPAAQGAFQATWRPPTPLAQNACTAAQIQGYYDSCLAQPITKATCDTFLQANAACGKCIESSDTDAQLGPLVWHDSRFYYTINVGGCIARELNDMTASGCGATWSAETECKQKACDQCFQTQNPSFQKFSDCESSAGQTVCAAIGDAIPSRCGNLHQGPVAQCFPATPTAKDAYFAVAPLFCGR